MSIIRRERLSKEPSAKIAKYTSSVEHDVQIVNEVIKINLAHVVGLVKGGILSAKEGAQLLEALRSTKDGIPLAPEHEDVHLALENAIISRLGIKTGGKIHVAKSRNDQVAAAIRMKLRSRVLSIIEKLLRLEESLLKRAEQHVSDLMPGYTHLQRAQPVTVAHYLIAHHDAIYRSVERLFSCYKRINRSPLGAAALAGTSFKIDRKLIAKLLGFDGLVENTMDAVSSRDFVLETLSILSILMVDVSRLSEEIVLWSSSEFNYVDLPDEHASVSSIMPQKKNPVTAEIMRAKAGHVMGCLMACLSTMKGLPLSYNLDFQELTPHLWSACQAVEDSIDVMRDLVSKLNFKTENLEKAASADYATATEIANLLFRKYGLSFREAHMAVSKVIRLISEANRKKVSSRTLADGIAQVTNIQLDVEEVRKALSPKNFIRNIKTLGGPSPKMVRNAIKNRLRSISTLINKISDELKKIAEADEALNVAINDILRAS